MYLTKEMSSFNDTCINLIKMNKPKFMKKSITLLLLVAFTSVFAQSTQNTVDYKSNFNSKELEAIGKNN